MSKVLKVTREMMEKATQSFSEAIMKAIISNGSFTYTAKFGDTERKATLYISEKAYAKQMLLVHTQDKEIAWHGTARRGCGEGEDVYFIDDILVYPQEVTGATVTTDQQKYQDWLYSNPDEVFNHLRMQGHSHVNMGVSPSTTDETLYSSLLKQLSSQDFYIFLILNKKGDVFCRIYDMATNAMFETNDVNIVVEGGVVEFLKDAKEKVTIHTYAANYQSGSYYSNYVQRGTNWPSYSGKTVGTAATTKKKAKKAKTISSLVDDYDDDDDDYYGPGYYNGQFH